MEQQRQSSFHESQFVALAMDLRLNLERNHHSAEAVEAQVSKRYLSQFNKCVRLVMEWVVLLEIHAQVVKGRELYTRKLEKQLLFLKGLTTRLS